ncbi:hypothetical protein GQ457_03G033420 [Hibiscus cannabinus]
MRLTEIFPDRRGPLWYWKSKGCSVWSDSTSLLASTQKSRGKTKKTRNITTLEVCKEAMEEESSDEVRLNVFRGDESGRKETKIKERGGGWGGMTGTAT